MLHNYVQKILMQYIVPLVKWRSSKRMKLHEELKVKSEVERLDWVIIFIYFLARYKVFARAIAVLYFLYWLVE